jgi:hypothetical protein
MYLHDVLQICLLALASRYPDHTLDMNETLPDFQCSFGAEGWTALDMIEMLESTRPELLQRPAYLIIDTQKSEIYVSELSLHIPALMIHCRGKIPCCQGNVATRQRALSELALR